MICLSFFVLLNGFAWSDRFLFMQISCSSAAALRIRDAQIHAPHPCANALSSIRKYKILKIYIEWLLILKKINTCIILNIYINVQNTKKGGYVHKFTENKSFD